MNSGCVLARIFLISRHSMFPGSISLFIQTLQASGCIKGVSNSHQRQQVLAADQSRAMCFLFELDQ